jgi:hypothetical protein
MRMFWTLDVSALFVPLTFYVECRVVIQSLQSVNERCLRRNALFVHFEIYEIEHDSCDPKRSITYELEKTLLVLVCLLENRVHSFLRRS